MEIIVKAKPEEIAQMLQAITSSKEQMTSIPDMANKLAEKNRAKSIFPGVSLKYPPVSKEEYVEAYEEYVRRCNV